MALNKTIKFNGITKYFNSKNRNEANSNFENIRKENNK